MASVKKRPDGKWRARYRGPDGRERSRHFERKVDAERWLSTQTADVARGEWIDPALGRMTFEEWVPKWRAGLHNLRPTTLALNTGVVTNHLLPRFGPYQLARIGTADIRQMLADDVRADLSSSAVRRRVIVLRQVLAAAVQDGRIARNPCDGVKLPPDSTREMRFLAPEQVIELADAIRPGHYRPLILTAAYVGLRWGELAGLPVSNVDLLRRKIRVTQQLVEINGHTHIGPPKTKAGNRTVTIPSAVADVLAEHIATEPVRSSGLVFPTVTGKPMKRANFRKIWRAATIGTSRKPGVFVGTEYDGLVFHELRHTAAALAIAQGAHPMVIRDRLGHSSITVTIDVYGGLFPSMDEALADALDGVLRASLVRPGAVRGSVVNL